MASIPLYTVIDTLGYIIEVGEKVIKITKNGEQPMKKAMMCDSSGCKIEFTLWRVFANLEIKPGQVIALKNVKVGEFNGRNISTFDESAVMFDPTMPEATELKTFLQNFTGEYKDLSKPSLNERSSDNFPVNVVFCRCVMILSNLGIGSTRLVLLIP